MTLPVMFSTRTNPPVLVFFQAAATGGTTRKCLRKGASNPDDLWAKRPAAAAAFPPAAPARAFAHAMALSSPTAPEALPGKPLVACVSRKNTGLHTNAASISPPEWRALINGTEMLRRIGKK